MGLQDLFRAWAIPNDQGVREARDGHRDYAAELLNMELDPLLAQSKTLSASLVGPDTRQNETKSRKNALPSTLHGSWGGDMALVPLVPSLWRGEGTHLNLGSHSQIHQMCRNVIAPISIYPLLKHRLNFLALSVQYCSGETQAKGCHMSYLRRRMDQIGPS